MQSGDDRVLRDMGRHYSSREYLEHVAALRRAVPHINVTTDAIVGFPTETPAAFQRTLDAIDAAGITRVHTFSYSPRPGTVAERLGDRVEPTEKKRRSQVLRGHSEARSRHHRAAKLGRPEAVLVDKVAEAGKVENLAVMHGQAPDLDEFLGLLSAVHPRDDIHVGDIGATIGVHAGPRVMGVTFQVVV